MKAVLAFFLKLVVLYLLLAFPWPGVKESYAAAFRFVADLTFGAPGSLVSGSITRFHALVEESPYREQGYDIQILMENRRKDLAYIILFKTRHGYIPTIMTIALCLATPLAFGKRLKVLGWSLVLIQVFLAVKVLLLLLSALAGPDLQAIEITGWAKATLGFLTKMIAGPAAPSFIVPVLVWGIAVGPRRFAEMWEESGGRE